MNNTTKVLVAGILGVAAGATAGILLAPEKGKKTRKLIVRKVEDLKENVEEMVEESKEYVKNFSTNGKVKETA
jgi:gas vesicle protein